ncbi:MAG: GNAT family N-acetyltransferase [Adhaeribacter sp.]
MGNNLIRSFLRQDPLPATGENLEVVVGEKVIELLQKTSFQREWEELFNECSWATVFQSRAYVSTWYEIYQHTYPPVLVRLISAGRLEGLLTLAQEKPGRLVGAGAEQAEYQVWLCKKEDQGDFIRKALFKLRRLFPYKEIKLKYIPGKVPVNWVEESLFWKTHCFLRKHKHPLLQVEEEALNKELQKKNKREKMNRLKRMGELTFEKITDPQIFAAIFDHLANQSDFRKGALFNQMVFSSDPLRKPFFLSLFGQGLLHATVLKLNQEIIAANVGAKGKRWVHLQGINTHAPHFAKYSPGILHFLLLGKCLAEEGFEIFDLSPGADSYKESLATKYTQAYELSCGNLISSQKAKIISFLKQNIKHLTRSLGMKPATLKGLKKEFVFRKEKIKKAARKGLEKISIGPPEKRISLKDRLENPGIGQMEVREQTIDSTEENYEAETRITYNKGSLKDLLLYDQSGEEMTRWQFLQEAMRRQEAGCLPLTFSSQTRLLACVWLNPACRISDTTLTQNLGHQETITLEGAYFHQTFISHREKFIKAVATEVNQA